MNQITKEHILKALQEIDENGIRNGRHSSTYDVVFNGKKYPPKLVISIANRFATGSELDPKEFHGGKDQPAFKVLEKNGFVIEAKKDKIAELIANYKKHIGQTHLKDELYKWELVNKFNGKPNLEASDFTNEIKNINYSNLVYALSRAVLIQLVKNKPSELKDLFSHLFDETIPLTTRVKNFNENSLLLYRTLGETLSHHQDERAISTYLTFHNPEKYTFYKNSFYKKICDLLGEKSAKSNEKYVHYLKLVNQLIEEYISKDEELIEMVKKFIPYYDGTNHLLLAQDILYQMLDKENMKSKITKILEDFINQSQGVDLKTKDYPKSFNGYSMKVSFGQGVSAKVPWLAIYKEPNTITKGIYPVFLFFKEINTLILAYGKSDTEKSPNSWENENELTTIENWFLKKYGFSAPRYGGSFVKSIYDLTNENFLSNIDEDLERILDEYENTFLNRVNENNDSYYKIDDDKMKISLNQILYGPPGTGKTYNSINKAIEIINPNFDLTQDREIVKKEYDRLVDEGQIVFTTFHQSMSYEDFIEGIKPLKPNNQNVVHYDVISGIFKTICQNTLENFIENSKQKNNSSYNNTFESLHQSFLELLKPNILQNKILFHTINNKEIKLIDIKGSTIIVKFVWYNKEKGIEATEPFSVTKNKLKMLFDANINPHEIKNMKESFAPFFKHNLSVYYAVYKEFYDFILKSTGFNPNIEEDELNLSNNYDELIENFKILTKDEIILGKQNSEKFVLIIDEINRGNVSQIFGELITLIEESKRLGKEESLEVTLPYSKEKFGIPPNLFIIGTMNTADRSVEALDTALRRRFSFVEMMPDYKVLQDKIIKGISLENVLNTINVRIEALLDRDHSIGHSYFINVNSLEDLENTFKNNIIPLLQEYFYNDYEKIALVLGEGFVEIKNVNNSKINFPKLSITIDKPEPSVTFKLRNKIEIKSAIQSLLALNE